MARLKHGLAAAALLLLLWGFTALAEEPKANTFYVSVSPREEVDGQVLPMDAVMWQRVRSSYYLFLPGSVSLEGARVWFGGGGQVTFNGQTLSSGDRVEGLEDGKTVRLRYQGKSYSLIVMQGSAIPAAFVTTQTGVMTAVDKSKTYKEPGALFLMNGQGAAEYDGALEHIKLRGNTSTKFDKKGYTIKLRQKTDLLGMGKAKKWILTSNARDHALIRNQICFDMAAYAGLAYTPECRQLDLYLNHQYAGVYILQEKIEIGDSRIEITDLEKATERVNDAPLDTFEKRGPQVATRGRYKYVDIPTDPEDITGGYLVEFEVADKRYLEEICGYTTTRSKVIVVKEPEYASEAQMAYISSYMQAYENAIFASDGVDPETGRHYSQLMDFDSLVLKYMIEEISKNLDGNKSSQFFYKPSDQESAVAFAGPAWDYDSTFGDYGREKDSKALIYPTGFYHNTVDRLNYWWPQLYAKPEFFEAVCRMWQERYAPAMRVVLGEETDPAGRLRSIAAYATEIEKSAAMNFILWPMRQSSDNIAHTGKSFKANIEFLKDFIAKRYAFLDGEWGVKTTEPAD